MKYGAVGVSLVPSENLVDIVWGSDRPTPIRAPAMSMPKHLHGRDVTSKLESLRQAMKENSCQVC